jgi:carbon-monoxide dehydrogenase small subunit
MTTELTVNGNLRRFHNPPMTPLARVLREDLHLTGTKLACGEGFCGSCTVFVDGDAKASCLIALGTVAGSSVRTVESMASPRGPLAPVQQAMKDMDAVQCGMCFPGVLASLTALLDEVSHPDRQQVEDALVGNICRCTGYERIVQAVLGIDHIASQADQTGAGA